MLALFAVLVVTAAVQTSRNAGVERAQSRDELVAQVERRPQPARDGAGPARRPSQDGNDRLEARQLRSDASAQGLLDRTRAAPGQDRHDPRAGPGVRVVVDDAPGADSARNQVLDTDLQRLVNGLWEAGAEAIAINGQRLTNLSTIRHAGGRDHGERRSLRPPYVVSAIGNQDTLPARFAETSAVRHGWTCSARSACS